MAFDTGCAPTCVSRLPLADLRSIWQFHSVSAGLFQELPDRGDEMLAHTNSCGANAAAGVTDVVWSLRVVVDHPLIEIDIQVHNTLLEGGARGNAEELIQHGAIEAFHKAVDL